MIARFLLTMGVIYAVFLTGILVERLYRRFARRNPQLGPFRKEGKQDCCSCSSASNCDPDSCKPGSSP
jgi:hypothetical protein